jgi:hypothetical protein
VTARNQPVGPGFGDTSRVRRFTQGDSSADRWASGTRTSCTGASQPLQPNKGATAEPPDVQPRMPRPANRRRVWIGTSRPAEIASKRSAGRGLPCWSSSRICCWQVGTPIASATNWSSFGAGPPGDRGRRRTRLRRRSGYGQIRRGRPVASKRHGPAGQGSLDSASVASATDTSQGHVGGERIPRRCTTPLERNRLPADDERVAVSARNVERSH